MCKVGFSGDDAPISAFPSVVGKAKYKNILDKKEGYVGDYAFAKRGVLNLNYPIEYNMINNW
jgi:actin-related protein